MVGKLFAVLAGRFLVLVKQVFRVFKSDRLYLYYPRLKISMPVNGSECYIYRECNS